MKLSSRITDALPLIKFVLFAALMLAGAFWFNGLLDARQTLRIQEAQQNAIDFTTRQFEAVIEKDRATAMAVRQEQDEKIAALSAQLKAIDTRTKAQVAKARDVVKANPEYQEKLDPEGVALWQAARDRVTRKGAPK